MSAPSAAGRSGSTERHSDAVMTNLIGDDVAAWPALAAEPNAALHLYGKQRSAARAARWGTSPELPRKVEMHALWTVLLPF